MVATDAGSHRPGPLSGVKVLEVGGIGPGPFAAMMLSDLGADVVRVDRPAEDLRPTHAVLLRGRRSVVADLKSEDGLAVLFGLLDEADILIEGFRPGVAERLGFGPQVALSRNPRLVYGRMTGWGQEGPYAALAGHDITYLAVAGVLDAFAGADGRPVPPLNLLGDFGGGGMMLALGVVAALWHARESGAGQVVDAAIVDGLAAMTAMHQSMLGSGLWSAPRGANLFDGGAPFYRCYRTADDRWLAVGAIEPVFYARFVAGLGLGSAELGDVESAQHDPAQWPRLAELFAERVAARPLADWVATFAELDACVAPVLTLAEARVDPHLAARGVYAAVPGARGLVQPAAAPRFSATPTTAGAPATDAAPHTDAVGRERGLTR
ncbi:alpha-methylacyl-CoA racemase [Pedococcus dokdonensis]|uniref:Alpha-methylacyl-CoA racemase n=1 Tax=Pedococcus dokdonensis TaxID=443156 RepID=A0A1H0T1P0_9MICO|nr:CaiB/BaiF CoA-transferase family protein [Pedococcus dokdonensis]SDP47488.1 alpha-methylacyl-CoA racemase [Pedococcus dokdonensis]